MCNNPHCIQTVCVCVSGMEDVAVIFGQSQLLVVDLPYSGGEAEFAQQG